MLTTHFLKHTHTTIRYSVLGLKSFLSPGGQVLTVHYFSQCSAHLGTYSKCKLERKEKKIYI